MIALYFKKSRREAAFLLVADTRKLSQLYLLLSLATYLVVGGLPFFLDDNTYLLNNRYLNLLPLDRIGELFFTRGNPWEFLPLRDITYKIELEWFDYSAYAMHLSNWAWYGLTLVAVFFATKQTLYAFDCYGPTSDWVPWVATALFSVHPAHVEAVAWIASRKDVMAGCFAFFAWAAWMTSIRHGGKLVYFLVGMSLAVAAMFSKAAAVAVIPLLWLALLIAPRNSLEATRRWAYFFLSLAVVVVVSIVHSRHGIETSVSLMQSLNAWQQAERALRIFAKLLWLQWVPWQPHFTHDVYTPMLSAGLLLVGYGLAVLFTLWLMLHKASRWTSVWLLVLAWSFLPVLPYLQLKPFITWSMASDRFVYTASVGVAFGLALLLRVFPAGVRSVIFSVVIGLGLWQTNERLMEWQDESTLWKTEFVRSPGFGTAVRQHVYRNLLPQNDYVGAYQAASTLPRNVERELLTKLIALDESLQGHLRLAPSNAECRSARALRHLVETELLKLSGEVDVPHIHFVKNIEWYLDKGRIAKSLAACTRLPPR